MASSTINFTTGPCLLSDVGKLSYNNCTFSPLFATNIDGKVVRDAANRTNKYMEYTLVADGYVTLANANANQLGAGGGLGIGINSTMLTLRQLLTEPGGPLVYQGRGFDLVVNSQGAGGGIPIGGGGNIGANINTSPYDVAWGPQPELLEFQPLGGGLSAKVQWKVTVRIPEVKKKGEGILQLNYETSASYNEEGFSKLSVSGTLEIPMTRFPNRAVRTINFTADDYRRFLEKRILTGIDLSRFRLTDREFSVSRDKRTLEWRVEAQEKPYMDLPENCAVARGTYSVRKLSKGYGMVRWLCTLKAKYVVRADAPRRSAWVAFLALLRFRMSQAAAGSLPQINKPQNPPKPIPGAGLTSKIDNRNAWLFDFSFEEGIYLDSNMVSFSASFVLSATFAYLLIKSGLWKKLPEVRNPGEPNNSDNNLWAINMKDVMGTESWLQNRLDPNLDIIVDFGGPDSINPPPPIQ